MYTKRLVIYPYKLTSVSAHGLARTIGAKRVRPDGRYRPRYRDLILNWGSTTIPNWWGQLALVNTLNLPQYVMNASHKDRTFATLCAAGCNAGVEYSHHHDDCIRWLVSPIYEKCLNAVVCRTLTRANS